MICNCSIPAVILDALVILIFCMTVMDADQKHTVYTHLAFIFALRGISPQLEDVLFFHLIDIAM